MLPFFSELVTHTDEARRAFEVHQTVLEAVANGMSAKRYQVLLLELRQLLIHTNSACAASASRLSNDYYQIRQFLYAYLHQDSGSEQLILNDLEVLGVDSSALCSHVPSMNLLALNGYNHWATDRLQPCSVLGMMYVLEVVASLYGGTFSTAIREALQLQGNQGVSFISSHAQITDQHMAKLRKVLNTVVDEPAQQAILESTLFNFHHMTGLFKSI
jgi:hypothetical protein